MAFHWTLSNSLPTFLCWVTQARMQYFRWILTRAEQRGIVPSLHCCHPPVAAVQDAVDHWGPRSTLLPHVQLLSTRILKSFSAGLLSLSSSPSGIALTQVQTACAWFCWTSLGLHGPTSWVCQGHFGYHPFLLLHWLHHTNWCHLQTCLFWETSWDSLLWSAPALQSVALISTCQGRAWRILMNTQQYLSF